MNTLLKKLPLLLIAIGAILLSSCDIEPVSPVNPNASELEVQVYGAISGAPREGIRVSLHASEYDARNNINPLAGYAWTDIDGFVYFYGLPPNEQYHIRAKALLVKSIRTTNYLNRGYNFQAVPIL